MANWLSFGAGCHTVWGSVTRGAECAEENRRDEIYGEFKAYDQQLFDRSIKEREFLFGQYQEILTMLVLFVLGAAFLIYYLRD
ncbi:hypothetical protein [Croceimicrobium hydrocarbonivorans]|uniref:Uncharacterized protein n=1 Tax=Croceimicrobium hydrocarbonivorans TaxID=2761580 RepID=A0A7H0VBA1_9FLAO|nr:hypothetical protein [Croceimicrobium hydrocarbonivorans]QNR22956.1 hypothetical protein H4K34_11260 [Croceimicrobium hydrocarbonivorans]QNR22999.1 hypothetical protein H4K34_11475 [Croceimicrobium hydrocarbonivorans]